MSGDGVISRFNTNLSMRKTLLVLALLLMMMQSIAVDSGVLENLNKKAQ